MTITITLDVKDTQLIRYALGLACTKSRQEAKDAASPSDKLMANEVADAFTEINNRLAEALQTELRKAKAGKK